jgi:hypothetical protein
MINKKFIFFSVLFLLLGTMGAFAQYTYYISSHKFSGGGINTTNCYAGAPGYLNNPSYSNLQDKGPLPAGTYYITGVQQTLNGKSHKDAIVLTPDSSNQMYNRHSFLIHGGYGSSNQSASNGCIILEDPALRKKIADAYNSSGSSVLTLYVYE